MFKSQLVRKGLMVVTAILFALCTGVLAIFALVHSKGREEAGVSDGGQYSYTFGKTYTINGKKYKLGNGEGEYIDYNTALGLDESATVTLTKFTYIDGSDGTADTYAVRNAGAYEFAVTAYNDDGYIVTYDETLAVATQEIHFDVNKLKDFVNAKNGGQYSAHGDITTIYKLNDAWYAVIIGDQTPVNTKTITNSYYIETGEYIPIKLKDEYIMGKGSNHYSNIDKDDLYANSMYVYDLEDDWDDGNNNYYDIKTDKVVSGHEDHTVTFNITNRTGLSFTASGEYIASYTMTLSDGDKNNYSLIYTDESKLTNSYRELDVPLKTRSDYSFVLTKHWYILNSNDIFKEYKNNYSEPYVPFYLNGKAIDTCTFTDDVKVLDPELSTHGLRPNSDKMTFAVEYLPIGGEYRDTITIREFGAFEYADSYTNIKNTLSYYINSSMPAGTYTLTVNATYSTDATMSGGVSYPKRDNCSITGEYKLYVNPKKLNAAKIADIQAVMNSDDNSFTVNDKYLHGDIETQQKALEATINHLGANGTGDSIFDADNYWSSLSEEDRKDYYDSEVTIFYNNSTWNINSFGSLENILSILDNSVGIFTFYFSVSAKNYVTTGGADDPNYAKYSFKTKRATDITDIYRYILQQDNFTGYFVDMPYTGSAITTPVPASGDYRYTFNRANNADGRDYITVGTVTVTLTLNDSEFKMWGDIDDWAKAVNLSAEDKEELESRVKFIKDEEGYETIIVISWDIVPAQNYYRFYPMISEWDYYGFNANANLINSTLAFGDVDEGSSKIYYRIGVLKSGVDKPQVELTDVEQWIDIYDADHVIKVGDTALDGSYFELDSDGKVPSEVALKLNTQKAGQYCIGSYVCDRTDGNVTGFEQLDYFNSFKIGKANNTWKTRPSIFNWSYTNFNIGNFTAGVPTHGDTTDDSGNIIKSSITTVVYTLTALNGTNVDKDSKELVFKCKVELKDGVYTVVDLVDLDDEEVSVQNKLKALHYGNYHVEVTQNVPPHINDYAGVTDSLNFGVTQAQNMWSNNPEISSWVYGDFSANLITRGEATFGTSSDDSDQTRYTVKYVINNRADDIVSVPGESDGASVTCENLTYSQLIAVLGKLNASGKLGDEKTYEGNYVLIVTVPEPATNDYYATSEKELSFTVSKANNSWKGEDPNITGWTYKGYNPVTNAPTPANIETTVDTGNSVVIEYWTATYVGGTYVANTKYDGALIDAPVGTYLMVVTVAGNDNYNDLVANVMFTVAACDNNWMLNGKDVDRSELVDTINWVWGADMSGSKLFNATAKFGSSITYAVSGQFEISVVIGGSDIDRSELIEALGKLSVGEYKITATVAGTNDYSAITVTATITVSAASLGVENPTYTQWTWMDSEVEKPTEAKVTTIKSDEEYTVKYVIVGVSGVNGVADYFGTFGEVIDELKKSDAHNAGTYQVNLTVTCANYNDEYITLDVEIKKISNSWDDNELEDFYDSSKTGEIDLDTFNVPGVIGTHVINGIDLLRFDIVKVGGESKYNLTTSEFKAYLKTLTSGTYNVTARMGGTYVNIDLPDKFDEALEIYNANYKILEVQMCVISLGAKPNDWAQSETIESALKWTWGSNVIADAEGKTIDNSVFVNALAKYADSGITYSIYYSGNGMLQQSPITVKNDLSDRTDLINKLKALPAGSYYVTITVSATANYGALTETVSITVNEAKFTINDPTADGWTWGTSWNWDSDESLTDKFSDIKVSTVKQDDIATIAYYIGSDPTKYGSLKDVLKELQTNKNKYSAGTYIVNITISCTNYTDETRTVSVEISRISNSWNNELAGGTFSGSVVVGNGDGQFKLPTASLTEIEIEGSKKVNLLRFDIVQVGGSIRHYSLNLSDFEERLSELRTGTYTITAYIGGSSSYVGADADLQSALAIYDANYVILTTTCEITVNLSANGWVNGKAPEEGLSWTWGWNNFPASSNFVTANALYADAGIVYSIVNTDTNSPQGTVTVLNNSSDRTALIIKLKELGVGTYTITISVDATDKYSSLSATTVVRITATDFAAISNPTCEGWTWGDSDIDGKFIDIVVTPVNGDNNAQIKKEYVIINGTVRSQTYESVTAMFNVLKAYSAGTYQVEVTVTSANYKSVTRTVSVEISRISNSWNNELAGGTFSGSVVVGNGSGQFKLPTAILTEIEIEGNKKVNLLYFDIVKVGGALSYYSLNATDFKNTLEGLTSGVYSITARIGGSYSDSEKLGADFATALAIYNLNYVILTTTCEITVNVSANDWTDKPESTIDWTWGWADFPTQSKFIKATAKYAEAGITYTFNGISQNPVTVVGGDATELIAALKKLGVGTYSITVSVAATDKYTGLSTTTIVTVSAVDFDNIMNASFNSWTWGESDISGKFTDLGVSYVDGDVTNAEIIRSYVIISNLIRSQTYYSSAEMLKDLGSRNAGTYQVEITVSSANYVSVTRTVSVVISRIANAWDAENNFSSTYSDDGSGVVDLSVFKIPDVKAGSDGKKIYGVNGIDLLRFDIVPNSGVAQYNLTRSDFITALGKLTGGTYTVYARLGGNGYYNYGSIDGFEVALTAYNNNYTILDVQTCVISLNVKPNEWNAGAPETNSSDSWTWGDDPSSKAFVTVTPKYPNAEGGIQFNILQTEGATYSTTVTVKSGNYTELYATLRGLNVGSYTITITVAATDAYGGLSLTLYVKVNAAKFTITDPTANGWTWGTSWNWDSDLTDKFTDIKANTVKDGDVATVAYYIGTDSTKYNSLKEVLKELQTNKDKYSAGTYVINIDIICANYITETRTLSVDIERIHNEWTAYIKDYNDGGTGVVKDFTMPAATIHEIEIGDGKKIDLLRFNIAKAGGDTQYNLTAAQFLAALENLTSGAYTVTVRLGGTGYYHPNGLDEDFNAALAIYNTNYTILELQTCVINIGVSANTWNYEPDDTISWTWGKHEDCEKLSEFTRPVATYGNNTIVFTLKQVDGSNSYVFDAADSDYENAEKGRAQGAFDDLLKRLKLLDAGTYALTISIAATVDYTAPQTLYVTFTINKVTTEWDSDSTPADKEYSWGYDERNGSDDGIASLIEPKVKSDVPEGWETISYTIAKAGVTQSVGIAWSDVKQYFANATVGTYTVTAIIAEGNNHTYLDYQFTVIVSATANSWSKDDFKEWAGDNYDGEDEVSVEWTYDNGDNPLIKLASDQNIGKLIITVDGNKLTYSNLNDDLNDYLSKLNSGTHIIVATIPADEMYEGLTLTINLTINKAQDEFVANSDDGSYKLDKTLEVDESTVTEWEWGKTVTWLGAQAKYSNELTVYITTDDPKLADSTNTRSFTFLASDATVGTRLNNFLSGLAANVPNTKYTMTVTIQDSINATGTSTTITFVVKPATNNWGPKGSVKEPMFSRNGEDGIYEWEYGTSNVSVYAPSWYGTYYVSYQKKVGNLWEYVSDMPTDAGTYKAIFTVDSGNNWTGLKATIDFTINKAEGSGLGFEKTPGVVAWNWNGYDVSVNLFSATPKSGGLVVFAILNNDNGKTAVLDDNGSPLEFTLTDGRVSAEVAKLLNKFTANTYILKVTVDDTDNYLGFTYSTTFAVEEAANRWITTPQIMGWSLSNLQDDNLPVAEALYGDIAITIMSTVGTTVYYDVIYRFNEASLYDSSVAKYVIEETKGYNELNSAPVGRYKMTVIVSGSAGKYKNLDTQYVYVEVYAKGSTTGDNYWITTPKIDDWVADIGKYNDPTAEPARGKPYFVFYEAVWDAEAETWRRGELVDENYYGAELVDKMKYAHAFWIPTAPGTYLMYSMASNLSEGYDGDNIEFDENSYYGFEIRSRQITWQQTVSIASTLYLGDADHWAQPTASTSLDNSVYADDKVTITYEYFNDKNESLGNKIPTMVGSYYVVATAYARFTDKITSRAYFKVELSSLSWEQTVSIASVLYLGNIANWIPAMATTSLDATGDVIITYEYFNEKNESLGNKIPTKPGSYYVIATARASYTYTITSRADFEVQLSTNRWKDDTSPTIDNWSEEFNDSSPDPVGAVEGKEDKKIRYRYINRDTGLEYSEKPTAAGNYTMIAVFEEEGYETLYATYDFVIEPAFDSTLLLICIILESIVIVLAIVVMAFAIRRNRQN